FDIGPPQYATSAVLKALASGFGRDRWGRDAPDCPDDRGTSDAERVFKHDTQYINIRAREHPALVVRGSDQAIVAALSNIIDKIAGFSAPRQGSEAIGFLSYMFKLRAGVAQFKGIQLKAWPHEGR